jgi:hypothetical protein
MGGGGAWVWVGESQTKQETSGRGRGRAAVVVVVVGGGGLQASKQQAISPCTSALVGGRQQGPRKRALTPTWTAEAPGCGGSRGGSSQC